MTTKSAKTYIETIGRRKTSTARVRMEKATKLSITVNDKEVKEYFPTSMLQSILEEPFKKGKLDNKYSISVHVNGGGIHSQAEAIRHGISRGLVKEDEKDEEIKGKLKKAGLLKRDPRAKERRKFGLKKARKSPQWSKR